MFSIVNEIKDNSPSSLLRVVVASIGSAASIYIVVSITGYITFGNSVVGNIVSMCKRTPALEASLPANIAQTRPELHPLLERLPSSSSFCSPSLCRFTHAGRHSMPSSSGGPTDLSRTADVLGRPS